MGVLIFESLLFALGLSVFPRTFILVKDLLALKQHQKSLLRFRTHLGVLQVNHAVARVVELLVLAKGLT